MKRLVLVIYLIFISLPFFAQQKVLEQIEENNTVLSALRGQADADKISNRTGLNPDNPEVGFGYLLGNHNENRTDFDVTQSFDFPTAYHHKRKVADMQNQQVDIRYQMERKNILLEAKNICIQLIYYNALSEKLKEQMMLTSQISNAYLQKYEAGDASVLEYNKAKYDELDAIKVYQNAVMEKEFLQAELTRLNGGIPIEMNDKEFDLISLPSVFNDWYADQKLKNKELLLYEKGVNLSKQNEKLQRSLNLPKLSAGYMSEKVASEHFQGVTVGVSIPLWENKNTVKQIKAQTIANQQLEQDANLKYYHQTEALYKKALNLKQVVDGYNQHIKTDNTVALLKKALDAGETSLIDFILELGIYYDMMQSMLETERDLHLTVAELMQWEL